MAGIRNLEQGIQAIQEGNLREGSRFLRIALRDPNLSHSLQATAFIWLAETNPDREHKIDCYNKALTVDPGNQQARKRLDKMLADGLPPLTDSESALRPPASGLPPLEDGLPLAQPVQPPAAPPIRPEPVRTSSQPNLPPLYRTVAVVDGLNDPGAAFFVEENGLLATTRLAVNGMENVTVEIKSDYQTMGRVVWSNPELDLALVQTDIQVRLYPFSTDNFVPENQDLIAHVYNGSSHRGRRRATRRALEPHWIPTTFRGLSGSGGNPLTDDRGHLVGMLTRNASRTSDDMFGLHISAILSQVSEYRQQSELEPNETYCPSCGHMSRAAKFRAYYCEHCGSVLLYARSVKRTPVANMEALYGENIHRPCKNCQSRVGHYDGICLRCGQPTT